MGCSILLVKWSICSEQIFIYWDKGTNNYADYYTKHHVPTHHINSREKYVLIFFHVYTIGFTHNMYPLYSTCSQKVTPNWWKFGKHLNMVLSISFSKNTFDMYLAMFLFILFNFFCFYDSIHNIFNVVLCKGVFISGYRYLTYISYIYYHRK